MRLRERSFLISTILNIAVISVLVLVHAARGVNATPSYDLGVVGGPAVQAIAKDAATLAGPNLPIRMVPLSGETEAAHALQDGSVDAVLSNGQIIGWETIDPGLELFVQTSAHDAAVEALAGRHAHQGEQPPGAEPAPLEAGVLHAAPADRQGNAGIAFIGVLLLYGQLFGYGIWVATGVIEEKASRVVEMLLSAIRPRQLLAGKIIGIGTLGLCQLTVIAGFAITLAAVTGGIPGQTSGAVYAAMLDIGWFILGFAFYASLFAAAGSLVSRMEELQNVIVPINLTILVSFFISVGSLQAPNSTIAIVASILPVSSALAMPVRIVLGAATPPQIALALVLLVGSTIVLVPIGARLYEGAVLRTGARVKLRDAWRAR